MQQNFEGYPNLLGLSMNKCYLKSLKNMPKLAELAILELNDNE